MRPVRASCAAASVVGVAARMTVSSPSPVTASAAPRTSRVRGWAVEACMLGALGWTPPATAEPGHAIAMHGEPAMPKDFAAFPYVNPDAPKGGRLVHGVLGIFDSLNPLIVKGIAPAEIR